MTDAEGDQTNMPYDDVARRANRDLRFKRRLVEPSLETWEFDQLLAALKANDACAHSEFIARFGGRIRAYATARGAEDPDGIVNETLLAVFKKSLTFTGSESHFTGAVFAIARNKIVDDLRRKERRPSMTSLNEMSVTPPSIDMADDYVSESITRSILNQLDADQRDVVIMRTLLGMSFREIGDAMDRQEVTVRVAHHRALARLRSLLDSAS